MIRETYCKPKCIKRHCVQFGDSVTTACCTPSVGLCGCRYVEYLSESLTGCNYNLKPH